MTSSAPTSQSPTRRLVVIAAALLVILLGAFALAGGRDAGAAESSGNAQGLGKGNDGGKGGKDGKGDKKSKKMEQPNIVLVMTDDQAPRTQIPEAMPNLFTKLIPRGTTFSDYVVTTPLCCPSRASLLTGQYGHNNGVLRNFYPDLKQNRNVLPAWLQHAGYNTAHVGKFLNSYEANEGGAAAVAPGWDLWFTQLEKRRYYNWKASKNGHVRHYGTGNNDQVTTVTNAFAARWTKRLARKKAPFYMQVDQYAPHTSTGRDTRCFSGPVPEPIDEHRFDAYTVPQPPSYNEEDVSDKPQSGQDRTLLTAEDTVAIEQRYRCTLESLYGVDRGIGQIYDVLKQRKELNDTVFIVTSDNGFFYGEHRIPKGKPSPYEENIRMPLTIVVPPKYRNRSELVPSTGQPVANIDLAPTMLDLAGADPCRTKLYCRVMDGRSMMPLLDGSGAWPNPRAIGIELGACDFRGVRYDHQVYFGYAGETATGCESSGTEFYDLDNDPYELGNLSGADLGSEYDVREAQLKQLSQDLSDCAGIPSRDPEPVSGHYCQ